MQFDSVPVTRAEQNCSILWCPATHAAAVIDPGGDLDRIECFLEWEQLVLELVLVTHAHPDHAGGAARLATATGRSKGHTAATNTLCGAWPNRGGAIACRRTIHPGSVAGGRRRSPLRPGKP